MSEIRITGGKYRGRMIVVGKSKNIRPTASRVREAVFSMIGHSVTGSFLDGFGGSGIMGIEAYSRGATSVLICEASANVFRQLRKNVETIEPLIEVWLKEFLMISFFDNEFIKNSLYL